MILGGRTFTEVVGMNVHEVIVEDKRKRMDENSPSQRPETIEKNIREIMEAFMKEKAKQKTTLTVKLSLDIETKKTP